MTTFSQTESFLMMASKRVFLAIPVPEKIKEQLYHYKKYFNFPELKWASIGNIHITLVFIGNIEEKELSNIIQEVSNFSFPKFSLIIQKLSVVKRNGRVSMIWAIFEESKAFRELAEQLSSKIEIPLDHPPKAHITLARVKKGSYLKIDTSLVPEIVNTEIIVNRIVLYESNLSSSGATYEVLKSWDLQDL